MAVATARRRTSVKTESAPGRGPSSLMLQTGHVLLTIWVVTSAVAPTFQCDSIAIGMLFSYPPRLVVAVFAGLLMFGYAIYGQLWRFMLAVVCGSLLIHDAGWSLRRGTTDVESERTLLAFNVDFHSDRAERLARICDELDADFLCLQEIGSDQQDVFKTSLKQYTFFSADQGAELASSGQRRHANLIGVRKRLLSKDAQVRVEAGITGNRTFAVRLPLKDGPLWLVNVHTEAAFSTSEGLSAAASGALSQARRHRREADQLREWLFAHQDAPVVLAGDFNASMNTYNLRFDGLVHAQEAAGHGVHRTFPRKCPVWGIDHVLADTRIRFDDYQVLDVGFSDHCTQVARFSRRGIAD